MEFYIVTVMDLECKDKVVIGVADSVDRANQMVKEYHGDLIKFVETNYFEVDGAYVTNFKIFDGVNEPCDIQIEIQTFNLNEI